MLTPDKPTDAAELFDERALVAELAKLADAHAGAEQELRRAVAQRLKAVLATGRTQAEQLLLKDRQGRRCAERLCFMMDEIIRVLFEFVTTHLYPSENPSDSERMAIVATGGYGRGLLAPGSDIDLLFLLPYKQTAWGESVAEAILYCLWDLGLKVGHATRSIDECIRQAKADMTIRTAILESRFLLGDKKLFDELMTRFDKSVIQGTGPEFVAAKLAEREERHRRAGQSRYLVEPNVKDGKGGLRDLHTLFWMAKYVYRVRDVEDLVDRGVFDEEELKLFRRCEDFQWSVRCNMHFLAGRAEERLSFDIQREIAVRLGYTEHPGMKDVERFMKHYFLIAKDVGDLTAIMCSELEDQQTKPAPVLSRMMAKFRPRGRRPLPESEDFLDDNNRLTIADKDVFVRDPVNLLRMFRLAQKHNLVLHPDAMRLANKSLKLIDPKMRHDPKANQLFLEILTSHDAEIILRRMNETGVLGRFVRAFGRVVAMMQFNMYHSYTVDEHLLRCIGVLAEIERGSNEEYILANDLMRKILPEHRTLLYVALFLHDIAKGRIEDHSIAGARIARAFCPRLGLSPADTDTVAWLVEQHLVMSTVAQSRDLSDRRTIENFAAVVQSLERMKLLTILTTADIRAVGPGVWNGWKAQLLRTLYYETEPVLTGGFSEVNRAQRVAMAQAELEGRVEGLAGRADRCLYRAALSGLLAQGRRAAPGRACAFRAGGRRRGKTDRHHLRARRRARRHRTDHPGARPSLAVVHAGRRLRRHRRQHRRCADLHHHRRPRARHHRGVARVRAGRRRDAPRRPHRRHHRKGVERHAEAAGGGGAPLGREGPDQGLRHRAGGDHQQPVVQPLHGDRGDRPRPARPALRADGDAVEAQPQHHVGACGDVRRARGGRVLRDRSAGRENRVADARDGDQALAVATVRAGRAAARSRPPAAR